MKICPGLMAGSSARALRAGLSQHCDIVIVADIAAPKIVQAHGSIDPFCRRATRGAEGAGKTLVTDYRFVGPGCATHKLVGWGQPQTPPAPAGAAA